MNLMLKPYIAILEFKYSVSLLIFGWGTTQSLKGNPMPEKKSKYIGSMGSQEYPANICPLDLSFLIGWGRFPPNF